MRKSPVQSRPGEYLFPSHVFLSDMLVIIFTTSADEDMSYLTLQTHNKLVVVRKLPEAAEAETAL